MRGVPLCCIKAKWFNPVDNVTVYDVCLLLHGEHYYALTSLSAWFGRSYYCMECEKHLITRISTSVNHNIFVACVRKRIAYTYHPTQDYVKNVLVYFATVPVSTITNKMKYADAQHRVKSVVTGWPERSPITFANHYIVLTVTMR